MNENRFLNSHQPQTLFSAVLLGYIQAVFNLLSLYGLLIVIAIALAAGCYGIANEKKWGYNLAVGAAVVQVLLLFAIWGGAVFTNVGALSELPVRRRARGAAAPPDEPRLPAHLVPLTHVRHVRLAVLSHE